MRECMYVYVFVCLVVCVCVGCVRACACACACICAQHNVMQFYSALICNTEFQISKQPIKDAILPKYKGARYFDISSLGVNAFMYEVS